MSERRHYRLTNEEWLRVSQDLKYAELKVLFHLRTLDPFGDRDLRLKTSELAKQLKLTKSTVSKALGVLIEKEYLSLSQATIRLLSKSFLQDKKFPTGNGCPTGNEFPTEHPSFLQDTKVSCGTQKFPTGNIQELELLQSEGSGSPNTLKTLNTTNTGAVEVGVVENSVFEAEPSQDNRGSQELKQVKATVPSEPENQFPAAPPLLQQVQVLGVDLSNLFLKKAITTFPDNVPNAIAALQEKQLTVKNPTRFLVTAINKGWRPERSATPSPDGWGKWFDEALKRRLVTHGESKDGVCGAWLVDGFWLPYEQLRRLSWSELEARLKPIDVAVAVTIDAPQVRAGVGLLTQTLTMKSAAPREPEDLSDVIAAIDLHLRRLQWSGDQLQAHLLANYGKASRGLMTDGELLNLMCELEEI